MSQIEVPVWVVARARAAVREFWENYKGGHDCGEFDAAMKVAITAALGAWVVPVGYENRWHCTGNKWLSRDPAHRDDGDSQPAYVLRQEKPE